MKIIMRLIVFSLFWSSLYAVDTIVADRPGFSTGTYTVQPGKLNIELGYNYSKDTQTLPLMVLRTGITSDFEIDIMYDGWNIRYSDKEQYTTTSNIVIGSKYRVYENNLYNITLIGLISLPTGSDNIFKLQNINPLFGVLWDYTLSEKLLLFGILQASTSYNNERVYDIQPAIGVSIAHTDKFGSFIELYSIVPFSEQQNREIILDGGLTYLINNDIQIDINMGYGLNKISDDFIGFGIAMQF